MIAPLQILVVDDEPGVREVLRHALEAEGYIVHEAGNKTEMFELIDSQPIDAVTLDLELGDDDGLKFATEIRMKRNVAVIMITGRDAPEDRIIGLEHGADEYIVKPFNVRETQLRIRNVFVRYGLLASARAGSAAKAPERYEFDVGTLNVERRELRSKEGHPISLADSEFDLLAIFLRHPQRILSRDELMKLLRGRSWSPLERTLDGHVARLRKKIEPPGEAPQLIKSVRGVGYVFTGEVHQA
ncbi:MAG: response regulator [Thermomicrobiales bacterium]